MGFEPTVPFPARRFSRAVPSTTRPSLLGDYSTKTIDISCPYCYYLGMRDTQRKGDIAKAAAINSFTSHGYDVAVPLTESASYDLIVDDGKKLYRVQAKYSDSKNKQVGLRRIHSNSKGYVVKRYESNSYDWLYIYTPSGKEYIIKKCLEGRNSIKPTDADLIGVNIIKIGIQQPLTRRGTQEAEGVGLLNR